jgi:hypothetical protein
MLIFKKLKYMQVTSSFNFFKHMKMRSSFFRLAA